MREPGYAHKKLSQHCSPVSPQLGGGQHGDTRQADPWGLLASLAKSLSSRFRERTISKQKVWSDGGKMRQAKFRLSQVHRTVHTYAYLYTFICHTCTPHSINFTWEFHYRTHHAYTLRTRFKNSSSTKAKEITKLVFLKLFYTSLICFYWTKNCHVHVIFLFKTGVGSVGKGTTMQA